MKERKFKKIIVYTIGMLLSTYAYSLEKLQTFPIDLIGAWIYETGDEKIDGCKTARVVVNENVITLVEECVDEGRTVKKYKIKRVLVDRAFFSDKIKEYHVLTEHGPNVVFDMLDNWRIASIYLDFWITTEYHRTIVLGAYFLR